MGSNIKKHLLCVYYRGEAFIPYIDQLPSMCRNMEGPFIMPVVDKYKDMGTVVMGKVEAGETKKGQSLLLMPNRVSYKLQSGLLSELEITVRG
jgi:peptide chain release factor subunit 3